MLPRFAVVELEQVLMMLLLLLPTRSTLLISFVVKVHDLDSTSPNVVQMRHMHAKRLLVVADSIR